VKKKILIISFILVLLFSMCSFAENLENEVDINLTINGYPVSLYDDVQEMPIELRSYNNRTFAPVRYIFEIFGLELNWNPDDSSITTYTKDGKKIWMKLGSKIIKLDDSIYNMDVTPMIINNRTFIPIKYLFDLLGVDYFWDGDTMTVVASTDLIDDFKLPKYMSEILNDFEKYSDQEYMFSDSDGEKTLFVDTSFKNVEDAKIKLINNTMITADKIINIDDIKYSYLYYNIYYNDKDHFFVVLNKNNKIYYLEFNAFNLEEVKAFLNNL